MGRIYTANNTRVHVNGVVLPVMKWNVDATDCQWGTGVFTVNEVRALRGRKPIEDAPRKKSWAERVSHKLGYLLGQFALNTWRGFVEIL